MKRFLQANADAGVDTLLKVVGVLRRRAIGVTDVKMTSLDEGLYSALEIYLDASSELVIDRAAAHLGKIIGLSDIRIGEV